jgi:hypothetical protein
MTELKNITIKKKSPKSATSLPPLRAKMHEKRLKKKVERMIKRNVKKSTINE